MVQNTELNRERLALEADVNSECAARLQDYLARTGLTIPDFARRVGCGSSTLRFFIAGTYASISGTATHLVKRLDAFMAAHPVAPQTRVSGELYETANVRIIKKTFDALLPRPVAYMIYAPPGSQKSFVLENQVAELNRDEISKPNGRRAFYVYARQNLRPRDMLRRVCVACGCRVSQDIDSMLNGLRFDYRHNRVLLVIDEAQHLSIDCFETLRELLDQTPYFSLLFAGSHDLKKKFDEFSATLEQWNSRIIAKVRLPGLETIEAAGIIDREIGDLFAGMTPDARKRKADSLIQSATVKDAFEKNRSYINIRTLTNALDQIKVAAAEKTAQKDMAVE